MLSNFVKRLNGQENVKGVNKWAWGETRVKERNGSTKTKRGQPEAGRGRQPEGQGRIAGTDVAVWYRQAERPERQNRCSPSGGAARDAAAGGPAASGAVAAIPSAAPPPAGRDVARGKVSAPPRGLSWGGGGRTWERWP